MGARACLALLTLLLVWPLGPGAGRASAQTTPEGGEPVQMRLFPLHGDTLLFEGRRTIAEQGHRITVRTTYTRPDGTLVQRTEGVYEADSLAPVSYLLEDARSGERESLRFEGGRIVMSYRASAKDAPATTTVVPEPDLRFTTTVVPTLLHEWGHLLAGETVPFRLLVPSRQDVYRFRLQRENAPALQRAGEVVVRLDPDTWFVRQLVDPLYFVLDEAPPHRLREFRGRSSVKTDGGADQDLRMVFSVAGAG